MYVPCKALEACQTWSAKRNCQIKTKVDSTLILVSSHLNGSLNTWFVELTVQSNACACIAGLFTAGRQGGITQRLFGYENSLQNQFVAINYHCFDVQKNNLYLRL